MEEWLKLLHFKKTGQLHNLLMVKKNLQNKRILT